MTSKSNFRGKKDDYGRGINASLRAIPFLVGSCKKLLTLVGKDKAGRRELPKNAKTVGTERECAHNTVWFLYAGGFCSYKVIFLIDWHQ